MEYLVSSLLIFSIGKQNNPVLCCDTKEQSISGSYGGFLFDINLSSQSMSYSHCIGKHTKYETGHIQECKCIESQALPVLPPYGVRITGGRQPAQMSWVVSLFPALPILHSYGIGWQAALWTNVLRSVSSLRNAGSQTAFTRHRSALS